MRKLYVTLLLNLGLWSMVGIALLSRDCTPAPAILPTLCGNPDLSPLTFITGILITLLVIHEEVKP